MKISEAGIALIKRFEGLELQSYQDIAGVWTIGYGHTETAGPNQSISEREAEELLRRDLGPRERAVAQLVGVALNQHEFDALVSFVYNVGATAFRNSTARRRLNRNDRIGAAQALSWWNKATIDGVLREVRGLTRRRAVESALFLTPVNPMIINNRDDIAENSRLTPVEESPRRESLGESRTIQGAAVAGGAGAAASTIGRESAEDLDQLEKNIENGTGLTEKPPGEGGLGDPGVAGDPGVTGDSGSTGDSGVGDNSGATDGPATDGPATSDGATGDGATGDGQTGEGITGGGATDGGTTGSVVVESVRPSAREKNAVDAQLQFALLVIILLSALYIVFARVDDWWKYRR